ncbi:MAG TPA: polysaccharide biosynthesis/export family protein [Terriglobales bacterium]|nr:polysaccharide biosynthesis/export family protein [Terriglobales bacterium]
MKNWVFPVGIVLIVMVAQIVCLGQSQPSSSTTAASTAPASNETASTPSSGNNPEFHPRDSRYRIQPGDTFDINFDLSPEFNQQAVAVQPDGFVTLHGISDIKVQGKTVPELTETLRTAYTKILNNPQISVVLKDFQKPYFIADGQVARPGKYDLRGDTTLTEAIAMAGGFLDTAKHSQVVLFRKVDQNWTSAELIDVKKMESQHNLREDPFLHPGDMLFVPKNRLSKIKPFLPNANMGAYAPIF